MKKGEKSPGKNPRNILRNAILSPGTHSRLDTESTKMGASIPALVPMVNNKKEKEGLPTPVHLRKIHFHTKEKKKDDLVHDTTRRAHEKAEDYKAISVPLEEENTELREELKKTRDILKRTKLRLKTKAVHSDPDTKSGTKPVPKIKGETSPVTPVAPDPDAQLQTLIAKFDDKSLLMTDQKKVIATLEESKAAFTLEAYSKKDGVETWVWNDPVEKENPAYNVTYTRYPDGKLVISHGTLAKAYLCFEPDEKSGRHGSIVDIDGGAMKVHTPNPDPTIFVPAQKPATAQALQVKSPNQSLGK